MENFSLTQLNEKIVKESAFIDDLRNALAQKIVGQKEIVNKLSLAYWPMDICY